MIRLSLVMMLLTFASTLLSQQDQVTPSRINFKYDFLGKPTYHANGVVIPQKLGKKYMEELSPASLEKIIKADELNQTGNWVGIIGGGILGYMSYGYLSGNSSSTDSNDILTLAALGGTIWGVIYKRKAKKLYNEGLQDYNQIVNNNSNGSIGVHIGTLRNGLGLGISF